MNFSILKYFFYIDYYIAIIFLIINICFFDAFEVSFLHFYSEVVIEFGISIPIERIHFRENAKYLWCPSFFMRDGICMLKKC